MGRGMWDPQKAGERPHVNAAVTRRFTKSARKSKKNRKVSSGTIQKQPVMFDNYLVSSRNHNI